MTYKDTLEYLFARLPMFQRVGAAAYRADLTTIQKLCARLGSPEKKLRCVHVGGTNGKGSVSHMLASVFQEAGYKTGLYTSPHLVDFRERIKVNGKCIPQETVVDFVENHKDDFEDLNPSFFEWTVALAFWYFRAENCHINIIEVGMGGRLDATNVITPDLSVITNIGLDHMAFLGNTKQLIAREKAGIIKAQTPIVVGKKDKEYASVFREFALEKNAQLHWANEIDVSYLSTDLQGFYQKENLKTALCALRILQKTWTISEKHIIDGLLNVAVNTGIRGRWELLSSAPLTIADVAHNQDGIRYAMLQLQSEYKGKLHIVWGMSSDKDLNSIMALLPQNAYYFLCEPDVPRAMSIATLENEFKAQKMQFSTHLSVAEAYQSALKKASVNDTLYIGGSLFVVADLLKHIANKTKAF
jgi:dihydrofolate synthase / folylpolyglutamate synthase